MKKEKISIQNLNNSDAAAHTVDVLYQKIGNRWYAFAENGDDVFVGSMSEDEIYAAESTGVEKVLVDMNHEPTEVA